MLTAFLFVAITGAGYSLALIRGPIWGLMVYANIYFNVPKPYLNWWAEYLPDMRWSFISAAVMIASMILHYGKLSKHKLRGAWWIFVFYFLTLYITKTRAIDPLNANESTYWLFTYCLSVFLIIKSLSKFDYLRIFWLLIIALAGNLSLKAYLYGSRIHDRLENIGPADAFSSNEFAILLAAIIPMTLPFVFRGKLYETIISCISLVFMLNAMILCNSKGAFLSLTLSTFIVFVFVASKKMKKYLLIVGICSVPVLVYLSDDAFVERMSSFLDADLESTESINELTTGRWQIFVYGLEMAKDHPLGVGPDGFRELSRSYMPEEMLTVHPGAQYGVRAAHNSYLQVLVEQGYLGLCIFLIICIYTMYILFASVRIYTKMNRSGTFTEFFLLAMNISVMVSMVGGMTGAQVYYEFGWWQIALSMVTYSFVLSFVENMTIDSILP